MRNLASSPVPSRPDECVAARSVGYGPQPNTGVSRVTDPDLDDEDRPSGWVQDVVRTWLPAILAVLLIRTYVFEPFRIPSGSMVPTLQIGDHVVVNKASYGLWVPTSLVEIPFTEWIWLPDRFELFDWGDPERGDIIVFRFPRNETLNYIKRVVGVPGDRIRVTKNQIFVNEQPMEQSFDGGYTFVDDRCASDKLKRYVETFEDGEEHHVLKSEFGGRLSTMRHEVTVPEGMVFVMGDNRDNSEDSREWRFVEYAQIKGKAHFVWFSWDSCNGRPFGQPRGERFFRGLYRLHED